MLNKLDEVLKFLPALISDAKWDSLVINRRKPYTYRVSTQLDNLST